MRTARSEGLDRPPVTSGASVLAITPRVALPPSLGRVALHMAYGLGDKAIASALGMSVATVRTYARRVYARLGVHTRVELGALLWGPPTAMPPDRLALPPCLARVADGIARGLADKEIACELDAPLATVRTYVQRIYARLGVRTRVELARAWRASGLSGLATSRTA